jgi:hypothetical protein
VIPELFNVLSKHFYEVNASVWASIRSRLVRPDRTRTWRRFLPLVKKGKLREEGDEVNEICGIPDGIIAHLTKECGGNMHDRHLVEVTSGSFEVTSVENAKDPKQVADLDDASEYWSNYHRVSDNIQHTRNNWVCYDFKEKRIVPSHYTVRTNDSPPGGLHLKSWLVEKSAYGENWREVDRRENNKQLNGANFTGTFPVEGDEECRFIRLVNIARNHWGDDCLMISAWEIIGRLIE